jgi:hypothetical protein
MRDLIVVGETCPRESTYSRESAGLNSILFCQMGELADNILSVIEPGKDDAALSEIPNKH